MLITTGTEYGVDNVFDLTKMQPYNLDMLYKSFTKYSTEVVLYLPRNSDLNQIARYAKDGKKLEVAHYAIMGASKVSRAKHYAQHWTDMMQALCVYFGDFKFDVEEQES
jgi:trimethylguanosine synthase